MKCIKFWSEDIGLCYLKCFTKTSENVDSGQGNLSE